MGILQRFLMEVELLHYDKNRRTIWSNSSFILSHSRIHFRSLYRLRFFSFGALGFLIIFYRCYVARTAERAAGELSPIVGVPAPQGCYRCAAGGGVSARCCPCSGHFSNTYQPRRRWYKDTPRRNCTMFPDTWRPLPRRFGTRKIVTLLPSPLHGSTVSPEAVPNHLAPQPPGKATGTRNLVAPWNQNHPTVRQFYGQRSRNGTHTSNTKNTRWLIMVD